MATVLLFHHALGLTAGVLAFADAIRAAGHTVHTPDLYEGRTFAALADGIAHAEAVGFAEVIRRGTGAAQALPADCVYAGFSLGVLPAQALAQTRAGARGALFFHACVPPAELGGAWPGGLALQIHVMADDALGDVDVAREVAAGSRCAALFLYPGSGHLFTDPGSADYDAAAAGLVRQRTLAFLQQLDGPA